MLGDGEFDVRTDDAGIEVWVTQMGAYMNMNTASVSYTHVTLPTIYSV